MLLKLNSTGEDVKKLQSFLNLKVDGSFGPKTELAVKEYLKKNGLAVDGIVGDKTWNLMFSDNGIIYNPINVHITKSPNRKIKYLVIHFTAGTSSKEGTAMRTRDVFLTRDASADYLVDDKSMILVNPDPLNYYCWAVGGGKENNGIYNKDCISIEICSSLKKGTTAKVPNHEGWYFTKEVIDNTIRLSKILMNKYSIPIDRVIRHYDVTKKLCPGVLGWNTGSIYDPITGKSTTKNSTEEEWLNFKNKLK